MRIPQRTALELCQKKINLRLVHCEKQWKSIQCDSEIVHRQRGVAVGNFSFSACSLKSAQNYSTEKLFLSKHAILGSSSAIYLYFKGNGGYFLLQEALVLGKFLVPISFCKVPVEQVNWVLPQIQLYFTNKWELVFS